MYTTHNTPHTTLHCTLRFPVFIVWSIIVARKAAARPPASRHTAGDNRDRRVLGYKASVEMVEMIIEDKIRRERVLEALKKEE